MPADRSVETIIIGAGIAGEACARRLVKAQRPFLLISEDLGGRISRSQDDSVNLGAYCVRADYEHVNKLVTRGRRINALTTVHHSRDGSYRLRDPRLFSHLPQAVRFISQLRRFQRHYQTLKGRCLVDSQAGAIRSDPYLWRLYQQPASEFIDQYRLGSIARDYAGPGLYGTTFLPLSRLTAFTLLLGALPILVPIYEFAYRADTGAAWTRSVLFDTVTEISQRGHPYMVNTSRSGSLSAHNVVVATPPDVAQRLLGLSSLKGPVGIHSFQITGRLRPPFARADINLFTDDSPICAIARQANGSILLCSHQEQPRLADYLTEWDIIEHRHWNPAFNLIGTTLLDCEHAPDLYLVGDHNICGLEDAYLTGLYAANQIINRHHADGFDRSVNRADQILR